TREQVSGLKEVNVRVDITRQNEFAHATDLSPKRGGILFSHRHALNLVSVDNDRGIRQHFAIGGVNHCRANERNLFCAAGERETGQQEDEEEKSSFRWGVETSTRAACAP